MCTNQSETAESGSGKNKSRRRSNGGKCARVHFDSHAGKNGPRWIPAARRQQHRRRVIPAARKFDAKKEVDTARAAPTSFLLPVFRGAIFPGRFPWAVRCRPPPGRSPPIWTGRAAPMRTTARPMWTTDTPPAPGRCGRQFHHAARPT
mgnify:CR=1 FL=1